MPTHAPVQAPLTQAETLTDEQVVERVLSGDVAFFEILMRRNNTRIYRALRALIKDEAEVEDAMQSTYLLAYSKLKSFRGGARFSTWLTQIALNEGLGRLRRDKRHPHVSLTLIEGPEDAAMPVAVAPPKTPEAHASLRELAGFLERVIDTLPELYRVVFVLREIEGLDTAETAAVLGVSSDVVKTRLFRAKAALKESLERMVGSAASEVFEFQAPRCNRVVENVMRELGAGASHDEER